MEHEIEIIDGYILTPRGQAATVSCGNTAAEVRVATRNPPKTRPGYIHTPSTAVSLKKEAGKTRSRD